MPLGVLIPFPNNALCVSLLRKDILKNFSPLCLFSEEIIVSKRHDMKYFLRFQGIKIIGSFVHWSSEADEKQSYFEVYLKSRISLGSVH